MIRHSGGAAVCAAIAACLAAARPSAAEPRTLDEGWPSTWNRVGPAETAVGVGLGVGLLLTEFVWNTATTPRWSEPILFDDAARNALRAGSPAGRARAATASDVGYIGLPTYAIAVEAGLVTWLGRGQGDAALQLALVNGEALVINGLLTRVVQKATGRSRPDAGPGVTDNTSFFSGHTSTTFTVASGLCVQHARLQIYGGVGDKLVCPIALAVAATTGILRIVADRHYASDVLVGAAVGSAVGVTVSWAHLRDGGAPVASLGLGAGGRALVYGGSF
jgi:membrane-associated phospholipid phosphatase